MGHRPFSKSVFLRLHRTGNFQARSAWEALEYLDLHWPHARTAHYRRARALCQSAVDGFVDAETARNALIDAAQRAGLLAHGWEVDGVATNTVFVSSRAAPAIDADEDDVTDVELIGYNHPREILRDPTLAPSRKKKLLAYWGSDIHAVAGAPALRCVRGITVSIDDIQLTMQKLDEEIDAAAMPALAASRSRPV
jgi:hypothetical protein